MTAPTPMEFLATAIFAVAVIHTFLCAQFQKLASQVRAGSVAENLLHLLGEVEVVFGLWAGVLIIAMQFLQGKSAVVTYTHSLNFTEPLFVLVIMTICATRPIINLARQMIFTLSKFLPMHREAANYFNCLLIGSLLGSFITEPAAMTVTALLLKERYYREDFSARFKYITLAALLVNVSIGGVLTPYAAPPVLMVAGKWGWDLPFMLSTFGTKALLACLINAALATLLVLKELKQVKRQEAIANTSAPALLIIIHLIFLVAVVVNAHHPVIFLGLFLFFLGVATATREYQDELKIRESLMVAFFLAGLVTLGALQKWWLEIVLNKLSALSLFLGTTALTAITDNAALTYLGAQVQGIDDQFKYALVAGAVTGGGLTVIANAPNPAGFAILQEHFGERGISPLRLFKAALIPTIVAAICFWGLRPH